jgi:hypothetical protein
MTETETYRVEIVVTDEGTVTLTGLPLHPGDRVEVIVRRHEEDQEASMRYSLRGKPYRYDDPLDGVAIDDWDVL